MATASGRRVRLVGRPRRRRRACRAPGARRGHVGLDGSAVRLVPPARSGWFRCATCLAWRSRARRHAGGGRRPGPGCRRQRVCAASPASAAAARLGPAPGRARRAWCGRPALARCAPPGSSFRSAFLVCPGRFGVAYVPRRRAGRARGSAALGAAGSRGRALPGGVAAARPRRAAGCVSRPRWPWLAAGARPRGAGRLSRGGPRRPLRALPRRPRRLAVSRCARALRLARPSRRALAPARRRGVPPAPRSRLLPASLPRPRPPAPPRSRSSAPVPPPSLLPPPSPVLALSVGVGVGVTHASFGAEVQSELSQVVRIIGFLLGWRRARSRR